MSFTGLRALTKRSKKEKPATKAEEVRNVTIVRSLEDVNMPVAGDAAATLPKATTASNLDATHKRFSQSETALAGSLHRSATDEVAGLTPRLPAEPLLRHSSERLSKPGDESFRASLLLPRRSYLAMKAAEVDASLALEIPKMGPSFGVDEFLRHTKPGFAVENSEDDLSEVSASSISPSPEMWEPKLHYSSSASSKSSLASDPFVEKRKPAESLDVSPIAEAKKTDDSAEIKPSHGDVEQVAVSPKAGKKSYAYLKQKPLPPAPATADISNKQRNQGSPVHIASLASRYSSSQPMSPVDRAILSKASDKTLSEATLDLERELRMLVDAPQSPNQGRNTPTPSNPTPNPDKKSTSNSQKHDRNRSTNKPHQTYNLFPAPSKTGKTSNTTPIKMATHGHTNSNSSSISDTEPLKLTTKPSLKTSSSTRFAPRKIKSSVHLPSLRRPKLNHSSQSKNDTKREQLVKSPVISLESEQTALARSTDRYIEAEIAKALKVTHHEEDDEEDAVDNDNNYDEEGEWSAIYPLKAVKKLGIPLMSSSHIPRLTDLETERALRPHLPKLDTTTPSYAFNPPVMIRPLSVSTARYPETPDDIQTGTFIMDSTPARTPAEEIEHFDYDTTVDSDKVFVGVDRIETEDVSPHTQDVPLTLGISVFSSTCAQRDQRVQSTVYELDEYGSSPMQFHAKPVDSFGPTIPSITDEVVSALMLNVNNLDELFNYAQVNRQFYRVFKANELSFIKNALFNMNPPAWELREMSPPWTEDQSAMKDPDAPVPQYTPSSYLRHYARDIFALAKLKTLILSRCSSFLRPETVQGLTGHNNVRAAEIDQAFWRIWTFCRIFGCGKNREGDINGQIDWLNGGVLAKKNKAGATVITAEPFFSANNVLFDPPTGFGMGNADGLTCGQLYDMTEIWNCLGTLVQEFHHECKEARIAGIFDGLDIALGDVAKEEPMLEEWTHYLLTLGPSALIGVSSGFPHSTVKQQFAMAKQMGLTKWEAPEEGGGSRSSFLREAISRIYERRMADQPRDANGEAESHLAAMLNDQDQAALRRSTLRNSIMPDFATADGCNERAPPYTDTADQDENTLAAVSGPPPPRYSCTFLDPVDRAIHNIVHDLGFSEHDAKWALKITDTGDTIDPQAAIQLLIRERQKRESDVSSPGDGSDCLVDTTKHRGVVAWQWA